MIICLDYDGTYTEAPDVWDRFISDAKVNGHRIFCVTMRHECEGLDTIGNIDNLVESIVFTGRKAKRSKMVEILGNIPMIWIDDNPAWIFTDSF